MRNKSKQPWDVKLQWLMLKFHFVIIFVILQIVFLVCGEIMAKTIETGVVGWNLLILFMGILGGTGYIAMGIAVFKEVERREPEIAHLKVAAIICVGLIFMYSALYMTGMIK